MKDEGVMHSFRKRKKPCPDKPPPNPVIDLGPVIKSPLDFKHYKAIQLGNGLKALLVSTCIHELGDDHDVGNNGTETAPSLDSHGSLNESVKEFNKKYLGIGLVNQATSSGSTNPKVKTNSDSDNWAGWLLNLGKSFFQPGTNLFPSAEKSSLSPPSAKSRKIDPCCQGPSAVCITVGAGSFDDPKDISGMAHLVEHSVFLGSKQFPQPNELFYEVYGNGGIVTASTSAEHTQYSFNCQSTALNKCLRILVDGLVNPLFQEEAVQREVEAIDSEYAIKQADNWTRLHDFIWSLAKDGHPLKKFYWGNKESLSHPHLVQRMKVWRGHHYKSNNMTVCIQAPFPIRVIEEMVVEHFSYIPAAPPNSPDPLQPNVLPLPDPFDKETFRMEYKIVPVGHMNSLLITWPLPPCYSKDYGTKPLYYICKLFNLVSPGGLIHYLKQKHWITKVGDLVASSSRSNNSFGSMLSISVLLTDRGYVDRAQVVTSIFSYIKLLREDGVKQEYFEEMQKALANSFHFQNWAEMFQSAKAAALALRHVRVEHLLTSQGLIMNFNLEIIKNCLEQLSSTTACFIFVSEENKDVCKDKTLACHIPFSKEQIPIERYDDLESVEPYPDFFLPVGNDTFLPHEIHLFGGSIELPSGVVFEDDKVMITHSSDRRSPAITRFVPSALITISLASPIVMSQGRIKQGMLELWSNIIIDNISGKLGHRFDDGLTDYCIEITDVGIQAQVTGPSCILLDLLDIIIAETFIPALSSDFFNDLKNGMVKKIQNHIHDGQKLSMDVARFLLFNGFQSMFEIRDAIQELSRDQFLQLITVFKSRMEVQVSVDGIVCQHFINALAAFIGKLEYKTSALVPEIPGRCTILPRGESLLRLQARHPAYATSVVINHYQFGQLDWAQYQLFRLLQCAMRRRLVNQLRTVEQLGYSVFLIPVVAYDSVGLSIMVVTQPSKYSCAHVDSRIDNFFKLFYNRFLNSGITPKTNIFSSDLSKKDLDILRKLYLDHLNPKGGAFRKLSIQITGCPPKAHERHNKLEEPEPDPTTFSGREIRVIDDIAAFRRTLGLYPACSD